MAKIKVEFEVPSGAFCLTKSKKGSQGRVCPELSINESWCRVFHKYLEEHLPKIATSPEVAKLPQCLKAEIKEGQCRPK